MLGEQIGEFSGKITGQRILDTEGPKIEVSISGTGKFKGVIDVTEMWTYWSIQRADGIFYGEGQGVIMTKDGSELATATGRGVGRRTADSGKIRYPSALFYRTNSTGKLSFLNNVILVNEYELDQLGNYTHKLWEWK